MTTRKHIIRRIESLGEFITLDDSSRWQIDSMLNRMKTRGWAMGDEIIVATYISPKFKITHPLKKEEIKAIQVKQSPYLSKGIATCRETTL